MTSPALSLETAIELSLAIGQLRRRLRAEGSGGELNLSQMATLVRLEQDGWTTTADLARAESMKPQSMGTILSALEQRGLVERRPHLTDGRLIEFGLTAAGVEARRRRSISKREWLLTAMEKLPAAEQKALIAVIPLIRRLAES